MPEAGTPKSYCVLLHLILAFALAVNLNSYHIEDIEQNVAESLKRPGKTVAFEAFKFLLAPRLCLGLGLTIAMQGAFLAVSIADLDLDFFCCRVGG